MVHKVKVVLADAGQTAAYAEEIIGGIPQYYAEKYRNIKIKQEAGQELTAGFLLKHYLGVCEDAQLIRTKYGKPMLQSGEVHFNLSHSGNLVALGIADMDIGVDLEKIMDVHWPSVKKVFSGIQQEQLKQTPEREQPRQFTRMWTECEAVLKLKGSGFAAWEQENGRADQECVRPEGQIIHWIRYSNYVIACAAYKDFNLSVEAGIGTAEWWLSKPSVGRGVI